MSDIEHPSERNTVLFKPALELAHKVIDHQFEKVALDVAKSQHHPLRWLSNDYSGPKIDHLNFTLGNNVFSVLLFFVDDEKKDISNFIRQNFFHANDLLSEYTRNRWLSACEANNLIGCLFPVSIVSTKADGKTRIRAPYGDWNLFLISGDKINPNRIFNNNHIPMSDWEICNLSNQMFLDAFIIPSDLRVLYYNDIYGIDPQILFLDKNGNKCWVLIRNFISEIPQIKQNLKSLCHKAPNLKNIWGFYSIVSLTMDKSRPLRSMGFFVPPIKLVLLHKPTTGSNVPEVKFEDPDNINM